MVKVSVLMPVYNTKESYLREAVESILKQSFSDFEFLIYDDGSADNVEQVIKSYDDCRIRYIKNEKNEGLIKSLNKGLALVSGEYIARMDSDDISLPERLSKQVQFMDEHQEVAICGTSIEFFPKKNIWEPPVEPKLLDLLFGSVLAHPTAMFRTSIMKKYDFYYNEAYPHAEDFALWAEALQKTKIYNLKEVLLKYRWHGENISILKSSEQQKSTNRVKEKILQELLSDSDKIKKIMNCAENHKISKKIGRFSWLKVKYAENIKVYLFGVCLFKIKRM